MTTLTPIDAETLAVRLRAREVTLIDIREADEYAREHIAGAISIPLSRIEAGNADAPRGEIVFHCKSGMRTNKNCARLAAHVVGPAFVLEGGLEAWKRAGLSLAQGNK
jgi:rhodanese-related sulfurtransferase